MCAMHLTRWKRHGDVHTVKPKNPNKRARCSVEACERPMHGHGLCLAHYKRKRRGSPVGTPVRTPQPAEMCQVEGCIRTARTRKCCGTHYTRLRLYGDPTASAPPRALRAAKRYRSRLIPGHPLAGVDGRALEHRLVLFDKIGPGEHRCHWCGTSIRWTTEGLIGDALVVDHVNHDRLDNAPGNLVASCNVCNNHRPKGTEWSPWRPGDPVGSADRLSDYCRKGIHRMTPENVYVRPDSMSRSCKACRRISRSRAAPTSKGTFDCADKARAAGIPVWDYGVSTRIEDRP